MSTALRSPRALLVIALLIAVPATTWAQTAAELQQQRLDTAHSVLQKVGLGTVAVTGTLGFSLLVNKPTLLGDGHCINGGAWFGEFGCNGGLSILHFVFAGTTLGIFVATEIIATQMAASPYESSDPYKARAMRSLMVANIALFATQPILGLISAHPAIIGIPPDARPMVSRILRTVHFGVGLGVATTYSLNAAFQW